MILLRRFIKLFLLEFLLLYIDKKHRPPLGGLFLLGLHVLCLLSLVHFPIYLSGLCPFVPYTAKGYLFCLLFLLRFVCIGFLSQGCIRLCLSTKPGQEANKSFLCDIFPSPMLRLEAGASCRKKINVADRRQAVCVSNFFFLLINNFFYVILVL